MELPLNSPQVQPLPLMGVRILDLSRLLPGPFATLVLGDMGAAVDKVEDTGAGDYLRHMPPQVNGQSCVYSTLNRNKRSIAIDLKSAEGREVLLRMLPHYDVLLESFRPGVLARLGLGHETLRAVHPKLIVCAITGYGQTGPLRDRAGHDLNYAALSGTLGLQGPADAPPQVSGTQVADIGAALFAAIAILGALRNRDQHGIGATLDIALTDSIMPFGTATLAGAFAEPAVRRGDETLTGGLAIYNVYTTQDGRHMALGALEPKFWHAFAASIGIDPDPLALVAGPHQVQLKAQLSAIFMQRTQAEWVALAGAGDFCLDPVLTPNEALQSAHASARNLCLRAYGPDQADQQLRLPITLRNAHVRAPAHGEGAFAILQEAGFSAAECTALHARATIAGS
jgi:alpha-methylacyl-CoA racemase